MTTVPAPRRSKRCPECSGRETNTDRGDLVCRDCGLVLEADLIDHGPEWRAFDSAERNRKSRVGAPTTQLRHDKGLTTAIDWRDRDGHGKELSDRRRAQVSRLRRWHERIRTNDTGERNLQFALGEIDRMASALGLPGSVRELASVLYRRALAEDLLRGRSIEGMSSAVLYAACRIEAITRSLDEIAAVSRVERTRIGRAYRYLARELTLSIGPTDPTEYVPRFRSALGLPERVGTTANAVIEKSVASGALSGKSPTGYAAGAIYIAALCCAEPVTQADVGTAAQVSAITVRNNYQAQLDALGLVVNDLSRGPRVVGGSDPVEVAFDGG